MPGESALAVRGTQTFLQPWEDMSFRVLLLDPTSGNMELHYNSVTEIAMTALCNRRVFRIGLLFALGILLSARAHPQAATAAPSASTAAWTVKVNGDIRWQQVTPAGALLVSTDAALAAVDIE